MEEERQKISYCIYDFMKDFGLNDSELKIYAFLYAYRKSEYGFFFGKRSFLSERCGVSLRTAHRVIPKLKEMGLIESVVSDNRRGLKCSERFLPDENPDILQNAPKPKYDVIDVGKGYFSMSREQYFELLKLVPYDTLQNYFVKMERMLENNMGSGVHPPKNYYRTLISWIHKDFSL